MRTPVNPTVRTDVLIIGAGPAGLTAAVYAARAGLSTIVLAGTSQPGGALTTTTHVDNFPGFPTGVSGPDLMVAMQEQAERFDADVRYEDATMATLTGAVKSVATDEAVYAAGAVIVATGSAAKHLNVPGEGLGGVSYCATCDGFFFAGRDVCVVGGGDSAVHEALYLAKIAARVDLHVRGTRLRAQHALARQLADHANVHVHFNSTVSKVLGQDGKVTGVRVGVSGRDAAHTVQRTDAVFVAIGHTPASGVFAELHADETGFITTHPSDGRVTATNVPGVFACGDVVDRTYRQAVTAAASGCQAALDAAAYLDATRSAVRAV